MESSEGNLIVSDDNQIKAYLKQYDQPDVKDIKYRIAEESETRIEYNVMVQFFDAPILYFKKGFDK